MNWGKQIKIPPGTDPDYIEFLKSSGFNDEERARLLNGEWDDSFEGRMFGVNTPYDESADQIRDKEMFNSRPVACEVEDVFNW